MTGQLYAGRTDPTGAGVNEDRFAILKLGLTKQIQIGRQEDLRDGGGPRQRPVIRYWQ